jgi:hypothetical protein
MTLHKDQPPKPWYKSIVNLGPREKPEKQGMRPRTVRIVVGVAVLVIIGGIIYLVANGVAFF